MKLTIDTKEDSHEDIKKVIKMLQHIIGDSQEVFTNQPPISSQSSDTSSSPFANIFGETSSTSSMSEELPSSNAAEVPVSTPTTEETSQSTEDLFAELFSEDELKKMDLPKEKEEVELKQKDKKYNIELY